jgi:hypothetical protein
MEGLYAGKFQPRPAGRRALQKGNDPENVLAQTGYFPGFWCKMLPPNPNQSSGKNMFKSLRPILLPAFFAAILVVSAHTEPQAIPVQTAPQSAGTQPASATPVKTETQLLVECVVGEHHECATDVSVPLGHHVKLKVRNLKSWIDQKNSPSNLVLFLNGRQLAKTYPVSVEVAYDPAHPELNELLFKLQRTPETDQTWDDLIVEQRNVRGLFLKGVSRKVRPSVGLEGGTPAESSAELEMVLLPLGWEYVCIAFLCVTLVGVLLLGRKTSLLRDYSAGPFSLARTQMAVWTWLLLNAYFFLFIMTWDPAVDIPTSILGLLGISSTTYLAAVLVDHNNTAKASSRGFWKDISGGENVELHRLQIIAWTVVLAFVFVVRIFTKLSIPDFNPTLLGLLGMSAGTYVGFKFPENKSSAEVAPAPKDAEAAKKMAAGAAG